MENVIQTAPQVVIPALYKAAAASVIALSVAGIGAMTGYLPVKKTEPPQTVLGAAVVPAVVPAPAAVAPPAPAAAPVAVQSPAPMERAPKPRVIKTIARTPRQFDEPTAKASPVSMHPVAVSASGNDMTPYPQSYPQTYPQSEQSSQYPQSYPPVAQARTPVRAVCNYCGTIENIRTVDKPGTGSGIGIAGGALGGGLLGRQFGNGRGRDVLTVLGAIGGGFAGNQVEKSVRSTKSYEVTVRMEDGSVRTIPSATLPNWRTGERVKLDGNTISLDYS